MRSFAFRVDYVAAGLVFIGAIPSLYERPWSAETPTHIETSRQRVNPAGAIAFNWEMEPRFGLDRNDNGRMDLPNSYEYVHNLRAPCPGSCPAMTPLFTVRIDLSGSKVGTPDGLKPATAFQVVILSPRTDSVSAKPVVAPRGSARISIRLPEGPAAVEATASVIFDGATRAVVDTFDIRVEDILIVSIGDSYASGEGNPERGIGAGANPVGVVLRAAQLAAAGDSAAAAKYVAENLGDRPYIWADDGVSEFDGTSRGAKDSPVIRDHHRAHRSTLSGPAQMAWKLEKADKRTSVTFISLAASGATIRTGLLGPYKGVGNEPLAIYGPPMPPQIDEAARLVGCRGSGADRRCDRQIDALLISVGGNDIGFSRAVAKLIDADPTWDGVLDPGPSYRATINKIFADVEDKLDNLPEKYDDLARTIRSRLPGVYNTYITTYPDPTLTRHYLTGPNGDLKTCDGILAGIGANLEINSDEAREARKRMIEPLNDRLIAAAREHGWIVADPRDAFKGHGICSMGGPDYKPANYPGNPFPKSLSPWPTIYFMRWFRTPTDAVGIQGSPTDVGGALAIGDAINMLDGEKFMTKGTLHPNEYGNYQIALTLFAELQLPVDIPGTTIDGNDQPAEATPLGLPAVGGSISTNGVLSSPTDVDMYKVTVGRQAPQSLEIAVAPFANDDRARLRFGYIRVFDIDGRELASGEGRVATTPFPGRAFYVAVSTRENVAYDMALGTGDRGGPQRGSYTLTMTGASPGARRSGPPPASHR